MYGKVEKDLHKQKTSWDVYDCNILTDGKIDSKHKSVMKLCMYCKLGTCFIKFVEDSNQSHT